MREETITAVPDPNGCSADPFTNRIRAGPSHLIAQALEAELRALLAQLSNETTPARPRGSSGDRNQNVRSTSSILPPYLRKARSVEDLRPWLYLKGMSTGDVQEALAARPGPNAAGLSSRMISRLKADRWDDYEHWQTRDLSARRIVYVWAGGVCFQKRM